MEEKIQEEKKNIVNNPDAIDAMIYFINKAIMEEEVIPPRHNLHSYFKHGHCNIYAQILLDIFGSDATVYAAGGDIAHIITKVGDFYYDVDGPLAPYVDLSPYKEHSAYLLRENISELGSYNANIDERIISVGVEAANIFLEKRVISKEQESKSM